MSQDSPQPFPPLPGQQKIHEFHVEARPIAFYRHKKTLHTKIQKSLRIAGWFTRRAITTQPMMADLPDKN
jgi:hypothetical protein